VPSNVDERNFPVTTGFLGLVGRILHIAGAGAAVALVVAAALAGARPAGAAPIPVPPPPASPWATINVCNTTAHPYGIGIRGRMAGAGDVTVALQMRFQLQYLRGARWLQVKGADSGWTPAGAGDSSAEAGRTFTVAAPPARRSFVLRGLVGFRWVVADGTILQMTQRVTAGGHPGTAGADPATFSAATCVVK
jgi:hypothetical protein